MNLSMYTPEPEKTCPHLGLSHDPLTFMDYPSPTNFCYHAAPPSSPSESHQRKFCLDPNCRACPLYPAATVKAMPKEFANEQKKRRLRFNIFPWLSIGSLLLVAGFIYMNWPQIETYLTVPTLVPTSEEPSITGIIPNTGTAAGEVTPAEPTDEPTGAPESEPTGTPAPTNLPTLTAVPSSTLEPTQPVTPAPTETASPSFTPVPAHALQTPFGAGRQYLVHRVLGGETLEWIARNHKTSVEAIRAANFNLPASLWEDAVIVIPSDSTDLEGIIPMKAVKISGDETSIELLAEEREVSLMLLCQVNDRPHSYVFAPGEWVLIPHPEATPTVP